jgi:bacterioferritin-associated ferredoxin
VREGAASLDAIAAVTGAGSCCGGCRAVLHEIVHEELGRDPGQAKPTDGELVSLRRGRAA